MTQPLYLPIPFTYTAGAPHVVRPVASLKPMVYHAALPQAQSVLPTQPVLQQKPLIIASPQSVRPQNVYNSSAMLPPSFPASLPMAPNSLSTPPPNALPPINAFQEIAATNFQNGLIAFIRGATMTMPFGFAFGVYKLFAGSTSWLRGGLNLILYTLLGIAVGGITGLSFALRKKWRSVKLPDMNTVLPAGILPNTPSLETPQPSTGKR